MNVRSRLASVALLFSVIAVVGVAASNRADEASDSSPDEAAIRATVERYFEGIMKNDADLLRKAFHPDSHLYSVLGPDGDRYLNRSFSDWVQFTRGREPRASEGHSNKILSIDQTGVAAVAKVELIWPEVTYVDYLSLLKFGDEWRIITKIWHQEKKN